MAPNNTTVMLMESVPTAKTIFQEICVIDVTLDLLIFQIVLQESMLHPKTG